MDIKEIKNENIKLRKINMKADYPLCADFEYCFSSFCSGFCMVINGYSGSGKTNLLVNLLSNNKKKNKNRCSFKKLFHTIFVVSPSLHTLENNIFKDLPDECKHTELNLDTIDEYNNIIKQQQEMNDEPNFNLLILDDVGNSIRQNKKVEDTFNKIISNRRHNNTSIIMLLQNITQIPPKIRTNLSHLITFKPKTIEEEERIYSFLKLPKKHINEFFKYIFDEPHTFLFIDMSLKLSPDFIFYKKFNKLEIFF